MQRANRVVPYDTGKVKIGAAYVPPVFRKMTYSEERLQQALLSPPKPSLVRQIQALLRGCSLD